VANGFQSLEVVRGKSRANAFQRFEKHHLEFPGDLCFLLVDSEGPVGSTQSVWDVVARREGDRWIKPVWASDDDLYLIVQFVETWLLTDPEALRSFFGPETNVSKLPNDNLEARNKGDIERALREATKSCRRGPYRHGHAHAVLERVRAQRVKSLYHGNRLFEKLGERIKRKARHLKH
jgi:hypothetical protein